MLVKVSYYVIIYSEKLVETNTPTKGDSYGNQHTKSQNPIGKSPNSLLVSTANKSGGRVSTDNPSFFANSPSSAKQKSRSQKSSESGNDEENASGRMMYDDPQVDNKPYLFFNYLINYLH